jgi:hypothetical protein
MHVTYDPGTGILDVMTTKTVLITGASSGLGRTGRS